MDCITESMSSKQKLRVLFGMVERDVEEIFNLAMATHPEERKTALIWEDLENITGQAPPKTGC